MTEECHECGGMEDDHDDGCYLQPVSVYPTIALAIPHTPWVPERAASMGRLNRSLVPVIADGRASAYSVFSGNESNRIWSQKLWRWGASVGASHLLQVQDDVIVAPNFWPALHAMIRAQPDKLIGLHANHPLGGVQFRAGRRWYRDHWLTGPAYVFPVALLHEFLAWCDANPVTVEAMNEDSLISHWAQLTKTFVWHPVPTITTVDQGVPSTYGNDGHHEYSMFRTPAATWRDAPSLASLEDPAYWRCVEDAAPALPGPGTQQCWFCAVEEGKITSADTGARIGAQCLTRIMSTVLGRIA